MKFELGQVCSRLSSGKGIPASQVSNVGEYPVYGGNGLRGYTDHANFEGECAIIGRQGAFCGNVRFFSGKAYMTEHAVVVCANENNNTRYLAYLLSTMDLGRLSGQSAQPGLSVKTLAKQEIEMPALEQQNKIVSILASLDNKIELNQKINENLLEQVVVMYNNFLASGKWPATTIAAIAEKVAMGPFGSNIKVSTFVPYGVPIISGNHLHGYFLEEPAFNYITEEHAEKLKNSIVYPHDLIFTHAGNIGQVAMIPDECKYSNTLKAAKQCGLIDAIEEDSKLSVGIRISDMLAGVLSKLLKSLHNALRYNQLDNPLQKKLLNKEWFQLNKEQLMLYKKLHLIICKLNNVWYKAFSGIYSDDLILLNSLLNYMEHFSSVDEIYKQLDMQGEYFNGYVCQCLSDYFDRLHHKHPIKPVYSSKDYFFNKRGAKVFFDIKRQPLLEITTETRKYNVLSVGFGDEGTPLVTIAEYGEVNCYRLPDCLSEWVMTIVSMANMGITVFPSNVLFTKCDGEYYADIL